MSKEKYEPFPVTRNQLANIREMDASNVSRKHLPKFDKLKNGSARYDLKNPKVMEFILEPYKKEWELEQRDSTPDGDGSLDDEKTKADIIIKKKQARKLDYEYSVNTKNTIPIEVAIIWIGAFRAGLETNFLTIGNKIARGNIELRNKIEKEISRAISKTKIGAAKTLRGEKDSIIDSINGDSTE